MGAKILLGTVAVVSLMILVLLVTIVDLNTSNQVQFVAGASMKKQADQKLLVHRKLVFNYVSKRRVPKGPDPIHNRRTGNSRRPPGQA